MKKLLIATVALATLSLASCNKGAETDENGLPKETADSISKAYGVLSGSQIAFEMTQADSLPANTKEQFLKGFQTVMGAEENQNTMIGMRVALNMLNEMDYLKGEGITLDRSIVIREFKKALENDSVDYMTLQNLNGDLQAMITKAMQMKQQKLAATGDQNPEIVKNGMIGKEYIDNLRQADPEVKTTSTGLSYKILEPGSGNKPAANANVAVNYTGRHLNGSVFDSNSGNAPVEFNLAEVVPGFREGIMLLGKGGKATLYIPGNLGYGDNGRPDGGIAPNEMLVFDIELVDVE